MKARVILGLLALLGSVLPRTKGASLNENSPQERVEEQLTLGDLVCHCSTVPFWRRQAACAAAVEV